MLFEGLFSTIEIWQGYEWQIRLFHASYILSRSLNPHSSTYRKTNLAALQEWDADQIYIDTCKIIILGYLAQKT